MSDPAGQTQREAGAAQPPKQTIDINRMVRYVTVDGQPFPAVVTEVEHPEKEVVSLFVMGKWTSEHKQTVQHDEKKSPNTWHWPPRG